VATVLQAYRFALDPTPRQRRALASHCGAARYAYNWGLHMVEQRLEKRRAGEDIEVPWTLPALRWLRRLNRELARRRPDSRRRDQTRRRLARIHARAANLRRDALHKLTTDLATRHDTIIVEQLNLSGLVRNRRLARVLSDAGLAELRRQLTYKTTWHGGRLIVADPFHPSSKTCSGCGWVKAKLTLAERTFSCDACGRRLDRDLNAARNLAKLAHHVAQSGWETRNARGADRRTQPAGQVATKREPSSRFNEHETGTASSRVEAVRHTH
jgi:putative transposase